jgi:trigger factor
LGILLQSADAPNETEFMIAKDNQCLFDVCHTFVSSSVSFNYSRNFSMPSVETVSALERRLNATIPQQAIRGQVANRLKHIGRTAKIAGFRPGKIPAKVLEQHYGMEARQEALGQALQHSFAQHTQTQGLRVVGNPEFTVKTTNWDADEIEYSATFEIYPQVVLGDITTEQIEQATYELSQDDVNNTIATLRKQRASYEVVDREAQIGDRVMIDFVGTLDGAVFPGGESKAHPVVLGSGSMLAEFEAALVGMKAADTKTFDVTFPQNYHGKDLAGRLVTFTVTLNSVEAIKLPDINTEFVLSIGIENGDVSKLEDEIRSNLLREVTRRLKNRNKNAAMDGLLRIGQFDLPKILVQWEAMRLMEQTGKDMELRGLPMNSMQLTPDLFRERAEKRVRLGLIFAELASQYDLFAQPEKVRAMVNDYALSFEDPEEVVRWYYAEPANMQEIENLVMEENVVEWVMAHAQIAEKALSFVELMGN